MLRKKYRSTKRIFGVIVSIVLSICILVFADNKQEISGIESIVVADPSIEQVDGDLEYGNAFDDITNIDGDKSSSGSTDSGESKSGDIENDETAHDDIVHDVTNDNQFGNQVNIGSLEEPLLDNKGEFKYMIVDGTATIIAGMRSDTINLVIHDKIDGYVVTIIGDNAFCEYSKLETVTLPDSLLEIGSNAFENCMNLQELKLPASLISIGSSAFCNCSSLKEIKIPKTVEVIEDYAFYACDKLDTVTVSRTEDLQSIFDMSRVKHVIVSEGVTSIATNAFVNCTDLSTVSLPSTLTSIKDGAFIGCKALEEITLPKGLLTIGESAFEECKSLQKIDVPDSVALIKDYAFFDCESMQYVILPLGIIRIGTDVFEGCSNIVIKTAIGTVGETYAKAYDIPYENRSNE